MLSVSVSVCMTRHGAPRHDQLPYARRIYDDGALAVLYAGFRRQAHICHPRRRLRVARCLTPPELGAKGWVPRPPWRWVSGEAGPGHSSAGWEVGGCVSNGRQQRRDVSQRITQLPFSPLSARIWLSLAGQTAVRCSYALWGGHQTWWHAMRAQILPPFPAGAGPAPGVAGWQPRGR